MHPSEVDAVAKRPLSTESESATATRNVPYGTWGKGMPALTGWLCDAGYEDGSKKGDVRLTVRASQGMIVVVLKVQDGSVQVRASDKQIDMALAALDALLRGDPIPWEPDPYPIEDRTSKKRR